MRNLRVIYTHEVEMQLVTAPRRLYPGRTICPSSGCIRPATTWA